MKNLNILTIAKEAGVSTATVSRALSGSLSIKDSTKEKILKIADQFEYRPSHLARSLSTKRTDTIGLILPELDGDFFMNVIHNIDDEVHKANKYLMVSSTYSQRDEIETVIEFMATSRVDGIILMAPKLNKRIELISKHRQKPIVFLNSSKNLNNIVNFTVDNFNGAKSIVEHLISHGYKKIGMIKGPEGNCEAEDRFNGYKKALDESGLNFSDEIIYNGDFTIGSGYKGFQKLYSQKNKPEAIFAANDMMAVGIYQSAKLLNVKIPNNIAVAGFDNIFLSQIISPRLTTVKVPIGLLASNAVQYLLKMINKEVDPNLPLTHNLGTSLIIGSSCGCKN
ncbi:MAG: LacI family DNA-binding transcriptional regulator [Ignavibacteriae bacterium]|nr:LacI family DNA-binding transcriptional regulator [Ignavibacteriota bacterium]